MHESACPHGGPDLSRAEAEFCQAGRLGDEERPVGELDPDPIDRSGHAVGQRGNSAQALVHVAFDDNALSIVISAFQGFLRESRESMRSGSEDSPRYLQALIRVDSPNRPPPQHAADHGLDSVAWRVFGLAGYWRSRTPPQCPCLSGRDRPVTRRFPLFRTHRYQLVQAGARG